MQPIPTPVTNVTICLYDGDAIAEMVVWIDGDGTYSVGTLTTDVFYNLNITSGEAVNAGPQKKQRYYATYTDAKGQKGRTPWLYCLTSGNKPTFGRTEGLRSDDEAVSSDIAYRIPLKNVTVRASVPKVEPLELIYLTDSEGEAMFEGMLPEGQWSVVLKGGKVVNPLTVGDEVVITSNNSGDAYTVPTTLRCTAVEDGDYAFSATEG